MKAKYIAQKTYKNIFNQQQYCQVFIYIPSLFLFTCFFPVGISRRMVRSPPGKFPLTEFIGREPEYDDGKFVAAPVKKGTALNSFF